jgi:hypothetical protein
MALCYVVVSGHALKTWYQMRSESDFSSYELEEIGIIQTVITRLAANSLIIKGWTVAVFVLVLLLSNTAYQALAGAFAVLVLWYLDAYNLRQGETYRALHKEIVEHKVDLGDEFFDVRSARNEAGIDVPRSSRLMLSKSLFILYGAILAVTLAYSGILAVLPHSG